MDLAFGFKSHGISREDLESHVRSIRFDLRTRKVIFDDALLPLAFDLKPGGSFVPPQNFDLPPTPQVLNEIYWLARRLSSGDHVLLVGETAAGKTSFVQYSHRLLNAALHYTNLSSESADEEVGGGYQPDPKNPGKFRFSQGLLEKAGNEYGGKGTSLFIDEFNLSSLVEWFNTAQDDRILITPEGPVTLGPDTVLIGAMNPPKYQGRNMLSPAIRGRYYEAWIPEADQNEAALRLGWTLKKLMDKTQKSAENGSSK